MDALHQTLGNLLAASPQVLALLVGLAAIGLAAFAIHVVHATAKKRDGDQ